MFVVQGVADVQPGEFVQILNTQTEHWLTIGCPHPACSDQQEQKKAQIASILHTQHKQIKLNFLSVHIQVDCGLFAVANATAIRDQQQMREHL